MDCAAQNVVTADTSRAYGRPIPSRMKSIVLRAGTRPIVQWTMIDARGCPVDLTTCAIDMDTAADVPIPDLSAPDVTPSSAPVMAVVPRRDLADMPPIPVDPPLSSDLFVPVVLRIVENTILGFDPDFVGRCVDMANGVVECLLDLKKVGGPGIYIAEFAILADDVETVVFSNQFTLLIERGLFAGDPTGLPTLAEIRLRLRDAPQTNELLGDFAWDNSEIIQALQEPIDFWNAELPDIGIYYTTQTFPAQYRHWWIRATVASLFRIAAEHQRRNQLDYAAGGVQVQDSNRSQEYHQVAEESWTAFAGWVRSRKIAMNVEQGWGSEGSPYHYHW